MDPSKAELLSTINPVYHSRQHATTYGASPYEQWYLQYLESRFRQLSDTEKKTLRHAIGEFDDRTAFYKYLSNVAMHITLVDQPSLLSLHEPLPPASSSDDGSEDDGDLPTLEVQNGQSTTTNDNSSNNTSAKVTDAEIAGLAFRCLGWLTFFFELKPPNTTPDRFCIMIPTDIGGNAVESETFYNLHKPSQPVMRLAVHQLLRHFSKHIVPSPWLYSAQQSGDPPGAKVDLFSEQLVVSYINFRTLSKVARIELEFVPYLGLHLEFDEETRRLKLFRFPSWCLTVAAATSSSKKARRTATGEARYKGPWYLSSLFKRFAASHTSRAIEPDDDEQEHEPDALDLPQLCREILLSYRVIFGQNWKASKGFRAAYSKHLKAANVGSGSTELPPDPLLRQLCESHWKNVKAYKEVELTREKTQYSASKDFPFLRERFVTLQQFVVDQDPNDLKTLLHDRRDILRYWTFWGVIYVGGLSVILALAQCVIGVLQIVLKD